MGKDEKSLRKMRSCSNLGKLKFWRKDFEGLSDAEFSGSRWLCTKKQISPRMNTDDTDLQT